MNADPQTTPQGDASRAIANLPCACSDDESCELHRLLEAEPSARVSCPPQNTDVRTYGGLVETVELVRRDLGTKLLGADGQSRASDSLKAVQHALHDLYAQEPGRARTRQSVAEAFMASRVVVSTREEWVPPLPAEAYAMADVALQALPHANHTPGEAADAESLNRATVAGAIVEDARGVVVKRVEPSEEGPDFVWQCGLWDYPESTRDIAHLLTYPVTIVRPGQRGSGAAPEQ